MPRTARIDYPGALHHVMVRGLERRKLFKDSEDYEAFLVRLEKALERTGTPCYAFCLMPNHLHLLLITGAKPIGAAMSSVLTSYALYFNKRHRRSGKLYQNRYKSILCDREEYFLELVRYIHLNPLRAGLVRGIKSLAKYRWCGHGAILGGRDLPWLQAEEVLGQFGKQVSRARKAYEKFVADGIGDDRPELAGGGLIRSAGGVWEAVKEKKLFGAQWGDERILGGSEFVEDVLAFAEEKESVIDRHLRRGLSPERVIEKAAAVVGLEAEDLRGRGITRAQSRGRALACWWLTDGLGLTATAAARLLGVSQPAVTQAARRGQVVEGDEGVGLDE